MEPRLNDECGDRFYCISSCRGIGPHVPVKGTSNCLAELQKNIETDSQFFLNFLYHIRGILPEININLPCSFPLGMSQTWWNLTIGFYGKHLTFLSH